MVETTTSRKDRMLEMFTDGTARESYNEGRLQTRETSDGVVELIAYGWAKIARYSENTDTLTIYTDHKNAGSKIMTRYVNDVIRIGEEQCETLHKIAESPYINPPNEGTKYIGAYQDFNGEESAVERMARNEVVQSIARVF